MSPTKMLPLASIAMAAIAFALPGVVQAQTHGLTEDGRLEPDAPITLTSTNLEMVTSSGTLACGMTFHYHVVTNTDQHVVLDPTPEATKNATTETCRLVTGSGATHTVHYLSAGTHRITFDTWGTGTAEASFIAEITFPFFTATCTYTGKMHLQATTTTDIVHIGPSEMTGSGFGCGNGTISGTGTAETPDGTTLESHFKGTL